MLKAIVNSPVRSGDQTIVNGDLIIGTAGEGVNFTANTPAAGMTSQLLNWYEEGTWTPTNALSITVNSARYTRIGNQITVWFNITAGGSGTSGDMGGLPFTPAAVSSGAVGYHNENGTETWSIYTTGGTAWSFRLGSTQKQLSSGKNAVGVITYYV